MRSISWIRFRRYPELWVLLGAALAFWPLQQIPGGYDLLPVGILGFCIFLLPGSALVCIVGDNGYWWERLALAFVASLAVPGIVSQAAILLHTDITFVLWGFLILTAVLVAGAILRCVLAPGESRIQHTADADVAPSSLLEAGKATPPAQTDRPSLWLWAILATMVAAAVIYQFNSPLDSDSLDALSYVQNMRYDAHMMQTEPKFEAGLPVSPRFEFDAWLVDQALMSRITGQDPWDQLLAQKLPLMLLTLAAFFRLARQATGRRDAAAFATAIWILYLITSNYRTVAGFEVIARSDLDKVVGGYIILPICLSVVLDLFNRRRGRDWVWLVVCSLAAGLTHPITVVLIGLSLAWFGLSELFFERRWATVVRLALVAATLSLALGPAVYSFMRGFANPAVPVVASSLADTRDPTLDLLLRNTLAQERLWLLGNGKYILHPRLVLQAMHLPVLLGLPFLFWYQRRSRAARLLFGMLVVVSFVALFPPTADLLGRLITPWLFYRLHWPVSMAAALALGWGGWSLLQRIPTSRLRGLPVQTKEGVVVACWLVLLAATLPAARSSFRQLVAMRADPLESPCLWAEPLLRSFQELAKEPAMVLAEPAINLCVVARAPYAGVMEWRDADVVAYYIATHREQEGRERLLDAKYFDSVESVDSRLLHIVDRWGIGYLIVSLGSPLEPQLRQSPQLFQPVITASGQRVFRVQRQDTRAPSAGTVK